MKRIAIIGGGTAGLAAAYELARLARYGTPAEAVLFESSSRFGGIVETVREGGFTIETGPDAWVSAKPYARELAIELGLESELIPSNDATRKTYIFLPAPGNPSGSLIPMPDGFNMMVPTNLDALTASPLFTPEAIAAYQAEPARAAELLASIPAADESVADFTLRHFGPEVLARVAAPLLSGVFGGDVRKLSVRAVMPAFVAMERQHGSLIAALRTKSQQSAANSAPPAAIFTTLRSGLGTLVDRLVAAIPPHWLRLQTTVTAIQRNPHAAARPWTVRTTAGKRLASETFDEIFLATPLDATRSLLATIDATAAALLPTESSSAVLVAFAFADAARIRLPPGFGFLVPPRSHVDASDSAPSSMRHSQRDYPEACHSDRIEEPPHSSRAASNLAAIPNTSSFRSAAEESASAPSLLLACTFTDQKFSHRVPPNGRLIRAFFGGAAAERLTRCNNDEIAAIARLELARILNAAAPKPATIPSLPLLTVVRRWPNSLPQYAVGHPARIAELESRLPTTAPGLTLLGNALHGVGLPDLIRQSRTAARTSTKD
jgi:oxygen-dependent protoporphyrinogen oxidase